MNILALDTSSKAASCAVVADGVLLGESYINAGLTHSQTSMPLLEDMLKTLGMPLRKIDCFAVTTGPGSFTGLRIGIAAVKGLAMALDKPCAGVSTLFALAANLRCFRGYIAPVMDARRSQVYTALFHCDGVKLTQIEQDDALPIHTLAERISTLAPEPVILVGDGAALCSTQLKGAHICLAPETLRHQRASSVAWAALEQNQFVSAGELEPVYLRLSQAERELLHKQNHKEENGK